MNYRIPEITKKTAAEITDLSDYSMEIGKESDLNKRSYGLLLSQLAYIIAGAESPVKRYKALLNRTLISTSSGLLVVGKTYLITELNPGGMGTDDFTNVGYVTQNIPFVATGTTPTEWLAGTIVYNLTDSPITATVIQNTYSTTLTWSYPCTITSTGEFTTNKTFVLPNPTSKSLPNTILFGNSSNLTDYAILIETYP